MTFKLLGIVSVFTLSIIMLIFLEIGRRIGHASAQKNNGNSPNSVGPVETIIFALLGLLLAFTFTGAESRFEARRQLITVEANAIGTAYLRVDLLPPKYQPQMRQLFKQYTTIRANIYNKVDYKTLNEVATNQASNLQQQIWHIAIDGCNQVNSPKCSTLLIPALNDMFDITTTRFVALQNHPPIIIYILLVVISLFGALLVGYNLSSMSNRNLLYMLTYALVISFIIYLIIDLELPRFGFIRINSADKVILSLIKGM